MESRYKVMKDERTIIAAKNFSIGQICESGQCFRMRPLEDGRFHLIAGGRRLELEQNEEAVVFYCGQQEYEDFWRNYFDLDADYSAYMDAISEKDRYLQNAAAFGSGIRILNQDLWEMIVSFIISQQNNIKRIRKCIDTVCEHYGTCRDGVYEFPTPEQLAAASEEELRSYGLGYRSRYLVGTARMAAAGDLDLKRIKGLDYAGAREELLKLPGVGGKVADCICLFGLHHLDAFPVDTHIKQVLEAHYPKGFPKRKYKGFRGVLQQYIFYYDLMEGRQDQRGAIN